MTVAPGRGDEVDLRHAIETCVGVGVSGIDPVADGDIGRSLCVTLRDGERLFAKHYPNARGHEVEREADGLAWLAEPGVILVAHVRGVIPESSLLLLDWIEGGHPTASADAEFGRGLAALHAASADSFGAQADNFIGSLPQSNRTHANWAAFYGEERIAAQVRLAGERRRLDAGDQRAADALIARLPELCGPPEGPARLHGDLWGGNRHADANGRSWLIDPAAYAGHREIDLAMMRLFGGFSQSVFDAYEEAAPLQPGSTERIRLFQLYPLLVHLNLFGGHYADSVRQILRDYS